MTYKELKRINDNNGKWLKDFLSSNSNIDKEKYKALYSYTLQEKKDANGDYLIARNNIKNYRISECKIYCLNDILEFLERLELGYITNLSLISKYTKIINRVKIKTTFIQKIIQKFFGANANLLHIHKVVNIKDYLAKLVLLGGKLLLSEDRVYFCQKGNNYYLVSEENMIFSGDFAGFDCIWANDFDKFACQTYRANVGDQIVEGDIRLTKEQIPDHDILALPARFFPVRQNLKT